MDLNRLLRFETSAKDMKENKEKTSQEDEYASFFFDSTLQSNSFAFIGLPGKIYGYQMDVLTCKEDDFSECNVGDSDQNKEIFGVKAWMTLITAPDGSPLSANIMPDDDNILTVVKGNSEGTPAQWLDVNSDNTVNIKYSLDDGVLGEIQNFNPNLDALSVGSSVIVPYAVTSTSAPSAGHDGYIRITRKL